MRKNTILLLLLLVLFTAGYAFPLLSQFENGVKTTLKNAQRRKRLRRIAPRFSRSF